MFKVLLTGTIVGGPHDGADITFSGTTELNEEALHSRMAKFRFDGHVYKIADFDKEKRHMRLHWKE